MMQNGQHHFQGASDIDHLHVWASNLCSYLLLCPNGMQKAHAIPSSVIYNICLGVKVTKKLYTEITTSKEELTPERWVFKELKITFLCTHLARGGEIAKEKAPQGCSPHAQSCLWI